MDDRDRRLKEIEKAGAIQGAGMAQNELASMAQEQKGNLLRERQALMQQSQERATVNQAAEMGVDAVADIAQQQQSASAPQPVAMNAQTQEILSKYGINPSQKPITKSATTTRSNSKIGSTVVENVTNTVTTNRNEIKIIQPNIPISQPQINLKGSTAKFKNWLQKANAQQEELATSQMNEYNRRERSLERSTSRMMRKLQELSKTISDKVDPENMVNSVSGSLKTFLFLYIASILPIVWKPIMNGLDRLEADVRRFFGLPMPKGLEGKAVGGGTSKVTEWKEALGMKGDLDSQSIFSGVAGLIKSSFERLMKELDVQKKDRERALSRVQKDKPDSMLDIQGWLQYLGKLIVAAVGGSEGQATYVEGTKVEREKTEEIKNAKGIMINGEEISMRGEFDEDGNLRNEDSALKMTQYLGSEIEKDTVDIGKIQTVVQKLRNFSDKNDKLIPVTPEIAKKINSLVTNEEASKLKIKYAKKGEYKLDKANYVYKRKTSDYDPSQEYSIGGRVWDGVKGGTALGATSGLVFGGISMPVGALGGSLIGAGVGALYGLGEAVYHEIAGRENMQMSLVHRNDLSDKEKKWLEEGKYVFPATVEMISPDMLSELLGMKDSNAFSSENLTALQNKFSGKTIAPINKDYQEAIDNVKKVEANREALRSEDTQVNSFLKEDIKIEKSDFTSPEEVKTTYNTTTNTTKANVNVGQDSNETAKIIMNYLKENLGLTDEQAAGVVGNLFVESGKFNLSAIGDKGTSFGLAQWHNQRMEALFKHAGTRTPNLEQQLDFLAHELRTTEKRALKKLKEAKTVEESSLMFAKYFERPAKGKDGLPLHFDRRWGYAEKFFALDGGKYSPSAPAISIPDVDNFEVEGKADKLDERFLAQMVDYTRKIAKCTEASAYLDATPRVQNNVYNTTPSETKHEVGWSSPI